MMKTTAVLLFSLISSVCAAPAVVWTNGSESKAPIRTSESLSAFELLSNVVNGGKKEEESSLEGVVFLIGRGPDGSETFSNLASSGKLPRTQAKYEHADAIHHHVGGIESASSMVRDAKRANTQQKVLEVNLSEMSSILTSLERPKVAEVEVTQQQVVPLPKTVKESKKRAREIGETGIFIVHVNAGANSKELDDAIIRAIEHDMVNNVVVAGVRSHEEVKVERNRQAQRKRGRMLVQQPAAGSGRRLEDENNDDEQQQEANDEDISGVYYVHMTPNILSGVMFTWLFAVVTWIGLSCMGMIAGQDVYVKKMPAIGREA